MSLRALLCALSFVLCASPVMAQQSIKQVDRSIEQLNRDLKLVLPPSQSVMSIADKAAIEGAGIPIAAVSTILYTENEYSLILKARDRFNNALSGRQVINRRAISESDVWEKPSDPGRREIALSGIVYKGEQDWTIWFNEQRVTPEAIPEEVLEMRVFNDYIELKWYDEYTNKIFPIRLRPNERFNIDMLLYLPG